MDAICYVSLRVGLVAIAGWFGGIVLFCVLHGEFPHQAMLDPFLLLMLGFGIMAAVFPGVVALRREP